VPFLPVNEAVDSPALAGLLIDLENKIVDRRRGPSLVPFLPVNEAVDSPALAGLLIDLENEIVDRRRGPILVSFLHVESVFRVRR